MDPFDVLFGIVCTSGAIGFGLGMVAGQIGTLWLRDCERCNARAIADAQVQQALAKDAS